jgi:hypothetical protein
LSHGHGDSYSDENKISAAEIAGGGVTRTTLLKAQVYGRYFVASRVLRLGTKNTIGPLTAKKGGPPNSMRIAVRVICRLAIGKKALLFVTMNGTSNDDPAEGSAGEKAGSVGQSGPNFQL